MQCVQTGDTATSCEQNERPAKCHSKSQDRSISVVFSFTLKMKIQFVSSRPKVPIKPHKPSLRGAHCYGSRLVARSAHEGEYSWNFDSVDQKFDPRVKQLPLDRIRRPLTGTRRNNQSKVEALMKSISEIGLQEPIDILEVEGKYYGFSGCHRYEACQRLGMETIKCRVRVATKNALKMHLM